MLSPAGEQSASVGMVQAVLDMSSSSDGIRKGHLIDR
jgi:hypothetical protein